ncbi:4'-phosphopantetheinyl transferase superfamily protein [Streptomyces sp. PTY087I2]|uniref:4'-phosphopantetheinyl transferase family protein n=1 Tax=Streptomyces sp. PTY087I2 TaxID=1819298 RepID=UPI0008289A06|nr:4'-phosphopantetheinyl transferase superfamily protein [Streptomyces sp. PTY087I2]OCC11733.1 4'-phosphopantetheinyl transferase sfp [Streptomyces sp. PTY087I2]
MHIPPPAGAGRPLLVHGTVEAWAALADGHGDHPDDAERLRALRDDRTRARFRASRLLIRTTLGALCGRTPDRIRLDRTALGRPYAPGLPELDFSLSHTGPLLAVAVLRGGRVGVDAERPGRRMSVLEHRMCTPHERAELDARGLHGADRDAELLRLWTLKEAYTKALGTGLRHPPRTFGLDAADPAGRPVPRDAAGAPLTGRLTASTHLLGGALVSVVAARPRRQPTWFEPDSSR